MDIGQEDVEQGRRNMENTTHSPVVIMADGPVQEYKGEIH